MLNSSQSHAANPIHVLTLTPFYPTDQDDATGCFIAEPLDWLSKGGIRNTVFAVQPLYRDRFQASKSAVPTSCLRYPAFPGNFGLSTAGAFLFARILGKTRELHTSKRIDLIHGHAPLPCGHAAMLLGAELQVPYVVSVHGLDAFSTEQVGGRVGQWCRDRKSVV